MTEYTEEELRLAHYIACRGFKAGTPRWRAAYDAALAAIRETTERAAKSIENRGDCDVYPWGSYFADELRNNEHLKGDRP